MVVYTLALGLCCFGVVMGITLHGSSLCEAWHLSPFIFNHAGGPYAFWGCYVRVDSLGTIIHFHFIQSLLVFDYWEI